MRLGNCAAPTTPSWARDSAMRTVAACTSRFSPATRCSSAVSTGSLNRFHQLGSIGSATGRLAAGATGSAFLANQVSGESHPGASKFGPTVQPASSSRTAAAGNCFTIVLISAAAPVVTRELRARPDRGVDTARPGPVMWPHANRMECTPAGCRRAHVAGGPGDCGARGGAAEPLLRHQRRRAPALSRGRATPGPHHRLCARLDHARLDSAAAAAGLRPPLPRRCVRSARPGRFRRTDVGLRAGAARPGYRRAARQPEPGPVLLVGWSLGVLDTLAYVHAHGDPALAGLVLVDNSVGEDPPPPPSRRAATRAGAAARGGDAALRAGHVPQPPERGLSGAADPGHAAHAGTGQPGVAGLSGAAQLLARGGVFDDEAAAVRGAAGMAGRAGGEPGAQSPRHAEVAVFAGAGHALFVDDAARFNALLADFISRTVWK